MNRWTTPALGFLSGLLLATVAQDEAEAPGHATQEPTAAAPTETPPHAPTGVRIRTADGGIELVPTWDGTIFIEQGALELDDRTITHALQYARAVHDPGYFALGQVPGSAQSNAQLHRRVSHLEAMVSMLVEVVLEHHGTPTLDATQPTRTPEGAPAKEQG